MRGEGAPLHSNIISENEALEETWEGRKAAAGCRTPNLVADGPGGARWGAGRALQVQHAGDEIADGDAQVAPEPLLQAGIVLRATEEAFTGQRIDQRGGVTDERPVLADDVALRKRALLRRRQNVAVKLGVFGRDALLLDESLEVAAELGAGMRGHATADSYREMVVA